MNFRTHIWNGWDLGSVVWVIIGVGLLLLVPTALTNYSGDERTLLMIILLCTGPLFLLTGFGRRLRHIEHLHEDPRPYDAPD
jgi:hypothetical protein